MKARTITTHQINGLNEHIEILVLDEPGSGGACHEYLIQPRTLPGDHPEGAINPCTIKFQKGGVAEAGVNGISNEALLAVVIDRLSCFQKGPFGCAENQLALEDCMDALVALKNRTRDRLDRGVEGRSVV